MDLFTCRLSSLEFKACRVVSFRDIEHGENHKETHGCHLSVFVSFNQCPFVIRIVIIMMNHVLYVSKINKLKLNKKLCYIHMKEDFMIR